FALAVNEYRRRAKIHYWVGRGRKGETLTQHNITRTYSKQHKPKMDCGGSRTERGDLRILAEVRFQILLETRYIWAKRSDPVRLKSLIDVSYFRAAHMW